MYLSLGVNKNLIGLLWCWCVQDLFYSFILLLLPTFLTGKVRPCWFMGLTERIRHSRWLLWHRSSWIQGAGPYVALRLSLWGSGCRWVPGDRTAICSVPTCVEKWPERQQTSWALSQPCFVWAALVRRSTISTESSVPLAFHGACISHLNSPVWGSCLLCAQGARLFRILETQNFNSAPCCCSWCPQTGPSVPLH